MPKLSIITVNLNNAEGLERTIKSVHNLRRSTPCSIEYVVVDGMSIDGSLDVISRHRSQVDRFVSELDKGIADAFNKGVHMARGDWVIFINSGDCIYRCPDFDGSKDADILACRVKMDSKILGGPVGRRRLLYRNYLAHQGMFIQRRMFTNTMPGYYNESFRLGMDYHWNLRALYHCSSKIDFKDILVAEMEPDGRSISNARETFHAYHRARTELKVVNSVISCFLLYVGIGKITLGQIWRRGKLWQFE